ncbi:MAG TPA: GNAT family N-acetyltransferase [Polyangiaceae bacterium]
MNSPVGFHSKRLSVDTLYTSEQFKALGPEWLELEATSQPQPFQSFDWCWVWWENWKAQRFFIRDELYIVTFREADGRLRGIAPLVRTTRPGVGWLSTREIQSFGADPNLTELRTIVASRGQLPRVYEALMHHFLERPRDWDWLTLSGLVEDDALTRVIEQSFVRVDWARQVPNYVLSLPDSYEAFRSSLSRNIKESLRKCQNSLKRAQLVPKFSVLSALDDVDAGLQTFYKLHHARSELTDTVHHRDAFAGERSRTFLREICRRLAARGRLRIFQLSIDGNVVATRIAFICQDALYLYFSGYDPKFRQFSVMTTLLAEAIKYAIESGLTQVNLSTGRDVAKLRWGPQEILYRDVHIVSPTFRGKAARQLSQLAKRTLQGAFDVTHVPECFVRWRG